MTIQYTHPDELMGPASIKPVPSLATQHQTLFSRLELFLARTIAAVMVSSTLALGFLMAAQVLMRYGLESPFLGIEELAPMLALWAYFMGMVLATREQDHISGGIIALIIRNALLIQWIRVAGTLLCLAATLIFGYYAWQFAQFNFDLGRKSIYLRWPKSLWDFSMVTGFVLCSFYYLLQLCAEARSLQSSNAKS